MGPTAIRIIRALLGIGTLGILARCAPDIDGETGVDPELEEDRLMHEILGRCSGAMIGVSHLPGCGVAVHPDQADPEGSNVSYVISDFNDTEVMRNLLDSGQCHFDCNWTARSFTDSPREVYCRALIKVGVRGPILEVEGQSPEEECAVAVPQPRN